MNRLRFELHVWRHGWAWPLAGFLLIIAVALQLFALHLQRETQSALQRSRAIAPAAMTRAPTLALADMQAPLRQAPATAQQVLRIAAIAEEHGIPMSQATYEEEIRPELGMRRTHVTQPVRANYAQFRRYIEQVLREHPNVSLDGVSVRRDDVGQELLDVRLRWSLWQLSPAPAGSVPP
jgi:hypothetical protein